MSERAEGSGQEQRRPASDGPASERPRDGLPERARPPARDGEAGAPPPEQEPDPRFTLANERTYLAWARTALALVAAALAADQLLDVRSDAARLLLTLAPLVLAGLLPLVALQRWRRNQQALRRGEPLPPSPLPAALAAGVVVLVLLVAVLVVAGQL